MLHSINNLFKGNMDFFRITKNKEDLEDWLKKRAYSSWSTGGIDRKGNNLITLRNGGGNKPGYVVGIIVIKEDSLIDETLLVIRKINKTDE